MKTALYILLGIVCFLLLILIVGLILPKERTLTKKSTYDAPLSKVYETVINNRDWKYRTSLDDLKIIESSGDIEIWDEVSEGNTIRFQTKEKRPNSFYSFDMESKLFKGYWFAEFEVLDDNKTLFTATESIEYKNPFIRTVAYVFMDLGKYMEIYQEELRKKVENE